MPVNESWRRRRSLTRHPVGSKIAHSVDDLAAYAGAAQPEMLALLEKLSASDQQCSAPSLRHLITQMRHD